MGVVLPIVAWPNAVGTHSSGEYYKTENALGIVERELQASTLNDTRIHDGIRIDGDDRPRGLFQRSVQDANRYRQIM